MFLSPVPSYEDDDMFLSSRHWLSLNSSCPPQVTFRGWATCCRRSSTWWRMRWMLSGVLSPSWTRWWVWTVTWCNRLYASLLCVQWGINWVRAVFLTGSGVCVCVCLQHQNFEEQMQGMKTQLIQLSTLLRLLDLAFWNYLGTAATQVDVRRVTSHVTDIHFVFTCNFNLVKYLVT